MTGPGNGAAPGPLHPEGSTGSHFEPDHSRARCHTEGTRIRVAIDPPAVLINGQPIAWLEAPMTLRPDELAWWRQRMETYRR